MKKRRHTPKFPTYESARSCLKIIDGLRYEQLMSMVNTIYGQIGDPQNPVNWKDPEVWIPQRLSGENAELALRIWRETGQEVNPRYFYNTIYLFWTINKLITRPDGFLRLSEKGRKFLDNDLETVAHIDEYERLTLILTEVAEKGPVQGKDILEGYGRFCRTHTRLQSDSSIRTALRTRLKNLAQRGLIVKQGRTYQITEAGIDYLQRLNVVLERPAQEAATQESHGEQERSENDAEPAQEAATQAGQPQQAQREFDAELANLIRQRNTEARQQLAEYLETMNPYLFEHLVKDLLEAMGYDDVDVTSASNDKGVDVVADIELGISRVREVIQVKRQKGNRGRPVLDQLRGSIHRFDAVRATIITTGGFSKGAKDAAFEKGVAPITLIDGERLLALLIEHDIGIRRREIRVLEFDPESLAGFDSDDFGDE